MTENQKAIYNELTQKIFAYYPRSGKSTFVSDCIDEFLKLKENEEIKVE